MSYMYSNEPYQRVDESGLAKSMMVGAAGTAAIAGGAHAGLSASSFLQRRGYNRQVDNLDRALKETLKEIGNSNLDPAMKVASAYNATGVTKGEKLKLGEKLENSRSIRGRNLFFGSGLRGAATYGAMGAIGAAAGAVSGLTDD